MLNRGFSIREKILLLVCVLVGLGIFYYEVIYRSFQNSMEAYDISKIQDQTIILQAQVSRKKMMEQYLIDHKDDTYGELALYNNLSKEISELARIFDGIDNLSISWSDPTLLNKTVRRNANVSFSVVGYEKVVELVKAINSCRYRCLISDLSISTNRDRVLDEYSTVSVRIVITFFETIDENTNLEGLTVINN
ncbi:MAG: hypothetical protein J6S38_01680 [Erysipelotrichaceae bacterium]|nr:hypothetical protein [Erysipelotrichaceae bacterium]MBP5280342.1 hypothetical protein [Erysipelotrichaceae bacterium]